VVGKTIRLPIVDREIPIIADHRVEKEFGTGAVKVTPGHDPLDWDLGQTHKLPVISVIGTDGRVTTDAGEEFVGKTAVEARNLVIEKFRAAGLLEKEEDYVHAVAICSRSKTVIEPLVSRQWFVKMAPLAKPALQAVRRGQIKILPGRYAKVYYQWLENIRDWNISRQIWWGHRLPVWYRGRDEREETRVAVSSPGPGWRQDEDTLDTWFSSGLWTFSTLGWPSKTSDLKRFHPTDVMETAWDILFFWVARMVMLSKYLVHEVPFKTVYLHGLVLDREGKKMSRSKGNGIDPVAMVDKYGADALRMSLIIGNSPGQDFRLYEEKIAGYRNFTNKLWNIGRFVNSQVVNRGPVKATSVADRWIMWRLNKLVSDVTADMDKYRLSSAGQALYDFVWHDFADWYVEWTKLEPNPATLRHVYDTTLRLLHPFMPFVTEKLWLEAGHDDLLMVAAWPRAGRQIKSAAIAEFGRHQRVISQLRIFRMHAELGGGFGEVVTEEATARIWQTMARVNLRAVARLNIGGSCREIMLGGTKFHFPAEAVNRFEGWRHQEKARLTEYIERLREKLSGSDFSAHAPVAVIEAERKKLAQAEIDRRALE
jgi:valyl-tRNA synthetase